MHPSRAVRWIPVLAITGAAIAVGVALAGATGAIGLTVWQEAVLVAGAVVAAGLGIAEHRGSRADDREPRP